MKLQRKIIAVFEPIISAKDFLAEVNYQMKYTLGLGQKGITSPEQANTKQKYNAIVLAVKKVLMDYWEHTNTDIRVHDKKQAFYLSLEFHIGRLLGNTLLNMSLTHVINTACQTLGINLNQIEEMEIDPGLGNGGLGRLAACFIESGATLGLAMHGYGIRYNYGIFQQKFIGGKQIELPDPWLKNGYPLETKVTDDMVRICFGGQVIHPEGHTKREASQWNQREALDAIPYDLPVVGFNKKGNPTVNTLRLWSTSDPQLDKFIMSEFDQGHYREAFEGVISSDAAAMSGVLYPNDNHQTGKALRLKQQYLLVSASLQDIIRNYKLNHTSFDDLPEKVVLQLNDTHPSLSIPELMRILVDQEGIQWDDAWKITTQCMNYTNHTILPEALETWPRSLMSYLLPRHHEIIEEINDMLKKDVYNRFPDADNLWAEASLFYFDEEKGQEMIRMGNLAVVGSSKVNGVAELHSQLVTSKVFAFFYKLYPERFTNVTNGVTQRRWIAKANPELAELITSKIGDGWLTDLSQLKNLEQFINDDEFLNRWREIKFNNKVKLSDEIYNNHPVRDENGIILETKGRVRINPNSLFDVQVKRMHEYKRQLLDFMYIVKMYKDIKNDPTKTQVPRTFLFGGKSAPGYPLCKNIIHGINILAKKINNDPDMEGKLQVAFMENYNVSLAEIIIPAADLSEQISLAGKEASGTGNMKLSLNGALTIGTMDGANVEMAEEIGPENMFIFGMSSDEAFDLKAKGYNPRIYYETTPQIKDILNTLWAPGIAETDEEYQVLVSIADYLANNDQFMALADYESYEKAQKDVDILYQTPREWTQKSVLNTARMGKFSSDRSVMEYAKNIWGLEIPEAE